MRAFLIRHVKPVRELSVFVELRVMTLRTYIMRTKRIDFGDPGHGRKETGSHGTTRTDDIAVFTGLFDQKMRYVILHRVTVSDDAFIFAVQTAFHNFRQRISVEILRIGINDVLQDLFTSLDVRGMHVRKQRMKLFHLIRDDIRIVDDDAFSGLFIKERETLQHFFGCAEVLVGTVFLLGAGIIHRMSRSADAFGINIYIA